MSLYYTFPLPIFLLFNIFHPTNDPKCETHQLSLTYTSPQIRELIKFYVKCIIDFSQILRIQTKV